MHRYLKFIGMLLIGSSLLLTACTPPPPPVTKDQLSTAEAEAQIAEKQLQEKNNQKAELERLAKEKEERLNALKQMEQSTGN